MSVRRVVTGHTADGTAVVVSDEQVAPIPIGDHGSGATLLWGRDDAAYYDYDIVLEGTIGLELDDGVEVTLGPGDVVVQNGTRHRWHNRGETIARLVSVTVGAYNRFEGGRRI